VHDERETHSDPTRRHREDHPDHCLPRGGAGTLRHRLRRLRRRRRRAQSSECQAITDAGSVVVGSGLPGDPAAPEPASGYRTGKKVVTARTYMVVTANPLASKAGCDILRAGGNAADAAVTVQAVLGLVEPQSSGIGGGAFMLHYNASTKALVAYDGRETAPAASTENDLRWVSSTNQTTPLPNARASGRSIGTPGAVRMLDLAHRENGRLAWKELWQPAIQLATTGFPISGRLAAAIAGAGASGVSLRADAEAAATYFNADGSPKALGTTLTIPAYAATLTAIADGGADAFYTGPIAQAIVDKVAVTTNVLTGLPITPGKTTLADLAGYQAKKREPVCTTYRAYWVCGMSPPSSGGLAVAQTLGILENFNLGLYAPTAVDLEGGKPQVQGVHLVAEANRLAYADRNKYVADTDFVPLPGNSYEAMTTRPTCARAPTSSASRRASARHSRATSARCRSRWESRRRTRARAPRTSRSSTRPATSSR
jgi:gamma-glutamyltranspeptidase/glutathione hydrolase